MTLQTTADGRTRCSVAAVDGDAIRSQPTASVMSLPLEAVDGGEIIKFAIKPSMWSPVIESAGWLVSCGGLAIVCIATGVGLTGVSATTTAQLTLAVGAVRLGMAIVRWVSSWYVLTNRRVVEIRGVRSPVVTAALLVDVRNTYLSSALHEKALRLATITFASNRPGDRPWQWKHVAEPEEVHAAIRRSIEGAIDSMP